MAKSHMSRKSEIIFRFLDIDRDGVLTWEEMMAFPNLLQKSKGKEELGRRLEAVYLGVWQRINEAVGKSKTCESLALEDFVTGTDIVRETTWFRETFVQETTDIYFECIDRNHDNHLTLAEWRDFYAARGLTDDTFTKATFDKVDTDANGEISREEFKSAFAAFSIAEDPNNDYAFLYDMMH